MKFCINLTLCFRAVNSAFLILAFALTGCTMTAYKSNSVAISAKPANYPIPIYAPEMAVPRPCEIIGTVSINAGKLAMFGGSVETELKRLMQKAHEKGADAVRLTDVEKPDFANPSYSLKAELLRYSTAWETVAIPENEFQAHLAANRQNLDPIEGVWFSGGQNPHSIGIVKNSSKPGRDFIGFILDSKNPAWPSGSKKIDIRRGLEPDSYNLTYYIDDFAPREMTIVLGRKKIFLLAIQKAGTDGDLVIYMKN